MKDNSGRKFFGLFLSYIFDMYVKGLRKLTRCLRSRPPARDKKQETSDQEVGVPFTAS